ncbi:hypothetical protein AGMMS49983_04050 [Clostridia bacterium]|nr:hypothetical protein AGMMS49983_04050 [Clostridia bacterium]
MKDDSDWVFKPEVPTAISVKTEDEFLSSSKLYEAVLSSIQDGICVLDPDFSVIYINKSMKHWYPGREHYRGGKCYAIFHERTEPCPHCPSLRSIQTTTPQTELVPYTKEGADLGWQNLYTVPVVDETGKVILVIEYIRDITFQKEVEGDISQLSELNESLEAQNNLLFEILNQREQYEANLERTVNENMKKYVKPSLQYLKKYLNERDYTIVSGIIDEIVFPVTKKRSSVLEQLSPRELQVATMIKEGYSSKEIAEILVVSKKTIDYHRNSIRRKLGLHHENLRSYLTAHG